MIDNHLHPNNKLKDFFLTKTNLRGEELEYAASHFHPKHLSKKEHLFSEGEICKFASFITKGCVRFYSIDENVKEHVLFLVSKIGG